MCFSTSCLFPMDFKHGLKSFRVYDIISIYSKYTVCVSYWSFWRIVFVCWKRKPCVNIGWSCVLAALKCSTKSVRITPKCSALFTSGECPGHCWVLSKKSIPESFKSCWIILVQDDMGGIIIKINHFWIVCNVLWIRKKWNNIFSKNILLIICTFHESASSLITHIILTAGKQFNIPIHYVCLQSCY